VKVNGSPLPDGEPDAVRLNVGVDKGGGGDPGIVADTQTPPAPCQLQSLLQVPVGS